MSMLRAALVLVAAAMAAPAAATTLGDLQARG
jgi:hypothetical protein